MVEIFIISMFCLLVVAFGILLLFLGIVKKRKIKEFEKVFLYFFILLFFVSLIYISWSFGVKNTRNELFKNSNCSKFEERGANLFLGIQRKTVCEVRQWRVIFKNGYIYVDDKRPRVDVTL